MAYFSIFILFSMAYFRIMRILIVFHGVPWSSMAYFSVTQLRLKIILMLDKSKFHKFYLCLNITEEMHSKNVILYKKAGRCKSKKI